MAPTESDRVGPNEYVTLPIRKDRTGRAPPAMEHWPLLEAATGEARIQPDACWHDVLTRMVIPTSVTSSGARVIIEESSGMTVYSVAAEPEPPHFLELELLWKPMVPNRVAEVPHLGIVDLKPKSTITPANELRLISGLSPGLLARLFGVSRATFYNWMEGATPRDARFQHLVDVLSHMKDAQRRLPPTIDLAVWLRTPVSPGGRTPLDLLEQKRFATFRGLLVRARSAETAPPLPLPLPFPGKLLGREENRLARERISPTPRLDDQDQSPPEGNHEK